MVVTKEEQKYLDNNLYMGGHYPIHVYVQKNQQVARIEFLQVMADFHGKHVVSVGLHNNVTVPKEYLKDIINALTNAYNKIEELEKPVAKKK